MYGNLCLTTLVSLVLHSLLMNVCGSKLLHHVWQKGGYVWDCVEYVYVGGGGLCLHCCLPTFVQRNKLHITCVEMCFLFLQGVGGIQYVDIIVYTWRGENGIACPQFFKFEVNGSVDASKFLSCLYFVSCFLVAIMPTTSI